MGNERLAMTLRYYGISPWEIEVMYGYLTGRFSVVQEEIEPDDEDYVSFLGMEVPLAFNEEFFQWFEYRRWEKIKAVFKEMKRRRGSKNALKIRISFAGRPGISFVLDADERQWFDNAVEKIDFVLELLPYHMDPEKLPAGVSEVSYGFYPGAARWRLDSARSEVARYSFTGGGWKAVT